MKVVVLRGVFSSRTRRRETHLSRSTLYAIIAEFRIDQLGDVYASTTAISVSDKYLHNIIETSQYINIIVSCSIRVNCVGEGFRFEDSS